MLLTLGCWPAVLWSRVPLERCLQPQEQTLTFKVMHCRLFGAVVHLAWCETAMRRRAKPRGFCACPKYANTAVPVQLPPALAPALAQASVSALQRDAAAGDRDEDEDDGRGGERATYGVVTAAARTSNSTVAVMCGLVRCVRVSQRVRSECAQGMGRGSFKCSNVQSMDNLCRAGIDSDSCVHGLDGDVGGGHVEGLEHDLAHLLPVRPGVQGRGARSAGPCDPPGPRAARCRRCGARSDTAGGGVSRGWGGD